MTTTAFLATLRALLSIPVSLEALLSRLFERPGARAETPTEWLYWLHTEGLSLPNRRLLAQIVEALGALDWKHHDKPIRVCLRDRPP